MKTFMKTLTTLVVGMVLGAATITAAAPNTVQAVVSNFKVFVNGEQQQTKAPIVVDGSTYLPVREVAGILNTDVSFDKGKINLNTKGDTPVQNENEWTSLTDLTHKVDRLVMYPEPGDARIKINQGDKVIYIDILRQENNENKASKVKTSVNDYEISAVYKNGSLYFLTDDLIKIGVINQ